MALSLALHGLALLPLLLAGMSGGSTSDESAIMVELSLAAPAPSSLGTIDLPSPDEPPPVDTAEIKPAEPAPPQPPQQTAIDLPLPHEPPPPDTAEFKPVEPPKPAPKPAAKPAPKSPTSKPSAVTQTQSAPNVGTDQTTQQFAGFAPSQPLIVWEGKPRFRHPPKPPAYPPRAVELAQQGEALVRVRLEPDGSAAEIVLWRGSGFELLDRAALAAVRGWHFLPATRGGRAVAAWVEIPVRFHLR